MIRVDTREPRIYVERLKNSGVEVTVEPLEVGDYEVVGNSFAVVVERKEAEDYIQSIIDGRLFRQLYLMSHYYPLSYLMVIGPITPVLMERKFRREAYISSLIGSSLKRAETGCKGQVITLTLENEFDFILALKMLHKKLQGGNLVRRPVVRSHPNDLLLAIYSALPGVGEKRAERLKIYFPTLESLMKASLADLQHVLGRKIGKKVYEFLHYTI